jgi:hypothetical protein
MAVAILKQTNELGINILFILWLLTYFIFNSVMYILLNHIMHDDEHVYSFLSYLLG